MTRAWRRLTSFLALAAFATAAGPAAAQCAMCREAVAADAEAGGNLGAGFSYSIYIMVALPYLLLGTVTFLVWRSYRKKAAAERAQEEAAGAATESSPAGLPQG